MSDIVLRVRDYPWQWSDEFAHAYTYDEIDNAISLKYTGGSLLEIYDKSIIDSIKLHVKEFFYPIAHDIKSTLVSGQYNLYSYTYLLPQNIRGDSLDIATDKKGKLKLKLANTKADTEDNKKLLELYLSYFDELDNLSKDNVSSTSLYDNLLEIFGEGSQKPRYAYIASIADELVRLMPSLSNSLRKLLVGKRMMLPISRVKELDSSCIRFLIKQPGDTIQEKTAANDFKMMGIARVEKYDLLENRVLKDFVIRAIRECNSYIKEFQSDSELLKSERVRKVKTLSFILESITKTPIWQMISRQQTLPTPNYVLQNEQRYKRIWKHYLFLIRKERQLEAAFKFQDNTFRDISELFLQAAFCEMCNKNDSSVFSITPIGQSFIKFYKEQHYGKRVKSMPVGPFYLTTNKGSNYYVQLWTRAFKHLEVYKNNGYLKTFGTSAFIKFINIDHNSISNNKIIIVPIYTINLSQAQEHEKIENIFENAIVELTKAQSSLLKNLFTVGGLVLTNNDETLEKKLIKGNFALYSMSTNPNNWGLNVIGIKDLLKDYIEVIL